MAKMQSFKKRSGNAYQKQKVEYMTQPKVELSADSKKDNLCFGVLGGILIVGLGLSAWLLYFACANAVIAGNHKPVEWWTLAGMLLVSALAFLLARLAVTAAFLGSMMIAGKTHSWCAQEKICNLGLKLRKIVPNVASWATQTLINQMIQRGQYKEVIALGTKEYELIAKKNAKDQSLALLCTYIGIASQIQGDAQASILWNERAIQSFEQILAPLNKESNKGKRSVKATMLDGVVMQYASTCANLGANYFNVGNYGKAKKYLTNALEQLAKTKDSPEKQNLTKSITEQLSRLKHW